MRIKDLNPVTLTFVLCVTYMYHQYNILFLTNLQSYFKEVNLNFLRYADDNMSMQLEIFSCHSFIYFYPQYYSSDTGSTIYKNNSKINL